MSIRQGETKVNRQQTGQCLCLTVLLARKLCATKSVVRGILTEQNISGEGLGCYSDVYMMNIGYVTLRAQALAI